MRFIISLPQRSPARGLLFALATLMLLLATGCYHSPYKSKARAPIPCDSSVVSALINKDSLRVATVSSSTSYFIYKDEQLGYEYELAKLLAKTLGKAMKVVVAPNTAALFQMLDSALVDLVITPQAVTVSAQKHYLFCGPEEISGQVLVQRNDKGLQVKSVTDLIGKKVTVMARSRFADRLQHLSKEVGGGIDSVIISDEALSAEDLIGKVVDHSIDYTFADEQIARIARTYYHNIDISVNVGFGQRLRWVVRKDNECLAKWVDKWAEAASHNLAYKKIWRRYFEMGKDELDDLTGPQRPRIDMPPGRISKYDLAFSILSKHHSLGYPWQLLAAIAYHESRFNHGASAWSGARGLMGIMPRTGQRHGATVDQLMDPEVSIRVAIFCLKAFRAEFPDIADEEERLCFTLAAYNAGPGHIADARRLAAKHGKNPNVWENNVETYVKLKKEPQYYNDPVCKHGYLRGTETVRYVSNVLDTYKKYLPIKNKNF